MCGNGLPDPSEECDNGGTCYATSKAGQACTSDADCIGQAGDATKGICESGTKELWACSTNTDCPDSRCIKCKTVGGDGCAANCTAETDITFNIKQPVNPASPGPGESATLIENQGTFAPKIVLPLDGTQKLTGGTDRNGLIPFVVKAASVSIPKIPISVSGISACACVRAVALQTCGGTLYNKDGTATASCTAGFATAPSTCAGQPPCAYVHGPGNSATGVVGCQGLSGTDYTLAQTRKSATDAGTRAAVVFSGQGGPGATRIINSTALGQVTQACSATFCTNADPAAQRGDPSTLPQVTGTATGTWINVDNTGASKTFSRSAAGDPFICKNGVIDPAQLGGVASAFPQPKTTIPNDSVVTSRFFAE